MFMAKTKRKHFVPNFIGGLAYLSCLVQWIWLLIIFLPGFVDNQTVKDLLVPSYSTETAPSVAKTSVTSPELSFIFLLIGLAIGLVVVALSVYGLLRIPKAVSKTGRSITHKPVEFAVPLILRKKTVSQNIRLKLSRQMIFALKLLLTFLPTVLILPAQNIELVMSTQAIALVTLFLFACTFSLFCLQAIVSKLMKVDYREAD